MCAGKGCLRVHSHLPLHSHDVKLKVIGGIDPESETNTGVRRGSWRTRTAQVEGQQASWDRKLGLRLWKTDLNVIERFLFVEFSESISMSNKCARAQSAVYNPEGGIFSLPYFVLLSG